MWWFRSWTKSILHGYIFVNDTWNEKNNSTLFQWQLTHSILSEYDCWFEPWFELSSIKNHIMEKSLWYENFNIKLPIWWFFNSILMCCLFKRTCDCKRYTITQQENIDESKNHAYYLFSVAFWPHFRFSIEVISFFLVSLLFLFSNQGIVLLL